MRGTWRDVGAGHALEEVQVGRRGFMWAGRSGEGEGEGLRSASLSPSSQQPCPGVQLAHNFRHKSGSARLQRKAVRTASAP